jgi:Protein of unknown function (DUF3618)
MTQNVQDLERDIEESRARLDLTIDRIQDRLSVSGIVDEVMGSVRATEFGSVVDHALTIVRRNPVPVILIAAGVGWLVHRMNQDSGAALAGRRTGRAAMLEEESIPVLNMGKARLYDPDASPLHPAQDALEPRRELRARA